MAAGSTSRRRRSAFSLTPLAIAVFLLSAQCHAIDFGRADLFDGALANSQQIQQTAVPGVQASRHYVDFHKHDKKHDKDHDKDHCPEDTDTDSGSESDDNDRRSKTIDVNINLVPPHCPRRDGGGRDGRGDVGADQIANVLGNIISRCCSSVSPTSETQHPYYGTVAPTSETQCPYYGTVAPTSETHCPYYGSVAPTNIGYHNQLLPFDNGFVPNGRAVQPTATEVWPNNNGRVWPAAIPQETPIPRVQIPAVFPEGAQPIATAPQSQLTVPNEARVNPAPFAGPQGQAASGPFPNEPQIQPTVPEAVAAARASEYVPLAHVGPISAQAPRTVRAPSSSNEQLPGEEAADMRNEYEYSSSSSHVRPELGDPALAATASAGAASSASGVAGIANRWSNGEWPGSMETPAANSGDDVTGVQTEFSETVNRWDQMLRATKTAGLPELLNKGAGAPTAVVMPESTPGAGRAALRLDPFVAGGVDMYPTVELAALGHDAPGKIADDVWAVVDSLTLAEKAGQMTQVHVSELMGADGQLNATAVEYWIDTMKVGAIVDTPGNSPHAAFPWYSAQALANVTNTVQRIAQARGSRVPVLWGLEAARGAGLIKRAAMFPTGIGLAASFEPRHAYVAGRVAAKDARAAGYQWVFGPQADISVDKRRAQAFLGYGEDPALAAQMVAHAVRGLQGDYKQDRARVACCAKGYVGGGAHGAGAGQVSDAQLLEYHVPGFEAAVAAGAASLMQAAGSVNGEALGTSPYYLRRLLRDGLRFRGVLAADRRAGTRGQAQRLHAAADARDALFLALNNTSVDVGADGTELAQTVHELVAAGRVSEDRVTESAARILQLKKDLGLFERPYADVQLAALVGARQDVEAAQQAVRESLTLLKNERRVLPLATHDRVLFVGPHLNSTALLGGGWNVHAQGPAAREADAVYQGLGDSVMQGVRHVAGARAPVAYHAGFRLDSGEIRGDEFSQLVRLARQADKIVVGLGEAPYSGAAGGDLAELALDAHQIELVRRLHGAVPRAPIVAVLVAGRPRLLKEAGDIAAAVVNAHVPGIHGGLPIAELLYGRFSPSGRQPVTYPRLESQARDTMWQGVGADYAPAYPFGFGLAYSRLEYSNLTVSSTTLRPGAPVTVRVTVHNHGPLDHKESVLLFTSHRFRTGYEPELFRLRRFSKHDIRAGAAQAVEFTLTAEELAYYNRDLTRVIDPSPVNITVNALAPNERTVSINLLS